LTVTLYLWLNSVVSVSGTALVRPVHLRVVSVTHPICGVIFLGWHMCDPAQPIRLVRTILGSRVVVVA